MDVGGEIPLAVAKMECAMKGMVQKLVLLALVPMASVVPVDLTSHYWEVCKVLALEIADA